MDNINYQIEKAKSTLRGTMAAINSGTLAKWEMKEFQAARLQMIATIKNWVGIKREYLEIYGNR